VREVQYAVPCASQNEPLRAKIPKYDMFAVKVFFAMILIALNSVRIYEELLNHKLKILQVYYVHKEKLEKVAAIHNNVMNYIRTRQAVRGAFYKVIRCPFVLVGSVGGAVERGATTFETLFSIMEVGVQSITHVIPYLLATAILVLLWDTLRKLRKNLIKV
jgi:hypothetical protein